MLLGQLPPPRSLAGWGLSGELAWLWVEALLLHSTVSWFGELLVHRVWCMLNRRREAAMGNNQLHCPQPVPANLPMEADRNLALLRRNEGFRKASTLVL